MNYNTFALLLIIWCVIHSAMISLTVTNFFKQHFDKLFRYYRIFYNFVAIITFISVMHYGDSIPPGPKIFHWDTNAFTSILQILLRILGVVLIFAVAKHYNLFQFLGISQIRTKKSQQLLTQTNELDTTGIMGIVRHPLYLATLILFWARDLNTTTLVMNIIITLYAFVGTILEEKKLIRVFGHEYRKYQQQVSMIIPFKYLKLAIQKVVKTPRTAKNKN